MNTDRLVPKNIYTCEGEAIEVLVSYFTQKTYRYILRDLAFTLEGYELFGTEVPVIQINKPAFELLKSISTDEDTASRMMLDEPRPAFVHRTMEYRLS